MWAKSGAKEKGPVRKDQLLVGLLPVHRLGVLDENFQWVSSGIDELGVNALESDDATRVLRELKTKKSRTPVPITPETATVLRAYLKNHWKENPQGLLFPNRIGRPRKRANVLRFGLWPILRRLGLSTHKAGLHAFRHGLDTALADRGCQTVSSCYSAGSATTTSLLSLLSRCRKSLSIVQTPYCF